MGLGMTCWRAMLRWPGTRSEKSRGCKTPRGAALVVDHSTCHDPARKELYCMRSRRTVGRARVGMHLGQPDITNHSGEPSLWRVLTWIHIKFPTSKLIYYSDPKRKSIWYAFCADWSQFCPQSIAQEKIQFVVTPRERNLVPCPIPS